MTSTRWPPGAVAKARGRAPVRAAVLDLVAGGAQRRERRVVVGGHDGDVAGGRDDGVVGEEHVDLRRAALHPARALAPAPAGGSTSSKPSSAKNATSASASAGRVSSATWWTVTAAPGSRRGCASARRCGARAGASSRAGPRGRRRPRAGSPARASPSIAPPWPGTTWSACSTSGRRRSSVARYAAREPPREIIGISTGER